MNKLLLILVIASLNCFGQNSISNKLDTCTLNPDFITGQCYLNEALINESGNLIALDISCHNQKVKQGNYVVLDLDSNKILSVFQPKKWNYLNDAYFFNDSLFYISYGRRPLAKYNVFSIKSGLLISKVKGKNSPNGKFYKSGKQNITSINELEKGMNIDNLTDVIYQNNLYLKDKVIEFDNENKLIKIKTPANKL